MDAKDFAVGNRIDAWTRMPLADAVLSIWRFVFDEERLGALWEQYRGRNYEKVISFPTMTHLIADALLQYEGSGRRSFEKNIESGHLNTSFQAAYGKLARLPLEVSEALLRDGTAAVYELFPRGSGRELPESLQAFEVILLDGKALKKVAKRLKPLRGVGGGLLGGKAVVTLSWRLGVALAMHTHPDGDASERPLVKAVISQTDALVSQPRLFVGDRNFCDLVQAAIFTARPGDHFLVRLHGSTSFTQDPSRSERTGSDRQGRTYKEAWGWLGSKSNKGRRYVRKIRLLRPGEEDLVLVTDLVDGDAYPAADLLWLYHQRWDIEQMFQKVTEVFGLKRLIGGTPEACIFQFSFCLLLYNVIELLRSYIAQAQNCDVETISTEKLFDDVHRELIACHVVYTPEETIEHFKFSLNASDLRSKLQARLAQVWSDTWRQTPRQTRRSSHRKTKRGHESVYRILNPHAVQSKRSKRKQAAKRC
jgi:hypothetical protein